MSEYTFAQLWLKNKLIVGTGAPPNVRLGIRFAFYPGHSTATINEYLLPNNSKTKLVGLSKKNKDWIPFFNSLDTANNVLMDLEAVAACCAEKYNANKYDYVSLWFKPSLNQIWFVVRFPKRGILLFPAGDFNSTPTQLLSNIHLAELSKHIDFHNYYALYPRTFRESLPFPPNVSQSVQESVINDYRKLGITTNLKALSPMVFGILRNALSISYGHPVSEFQMD